MKRILLAVLVAVMVISLCTCGGLNSAEKPYTEVDPIVRRIEKVPKDNTGELTAELVDEEASEDETPEKAELPSEQEVVIKTSDKTETEPKQIPGEDATTITVEVWIPTKSGTKYHSKSTCSGMKNPECVSLSYAESNGFTACKKCCK